MAGSDREAETRPVADTGRQRHAQQLPERLRARAGTASARLQPALAPAAATGAGATHRYVERKRGPVNRITRRDVDGGADGFRTFVDEESAAHAVDRRRHRREVDDDFVGKTIGIVAGFAA